MLSRVRTTVSAHVAKARVSRRKLTTSRVRLAATAGRASWPAELLKEAQAWETAKKANASRTVELPEIDDEPKSAAGQVAVKLFNSAYVLKANMDELEQEFTDFAGLLETPEGAAFLVEGQDKLGKNFDAAFVKFVNKLDISAQAKRLLTSLHKEGELSRFQAALPYFETLCRSLRNQHAGVITTPEPLSPADLAFYIKTFTNQFYSHEEGATLQLTNVVDPSLIGGYTIALDNNAPIDRSYKSQIKRAEDVEAVQLPGAFAQDRSLFPKFLF